jgi:hypothetical protein
VILQETTQYLEKQFLLTGLRFSSAFQNFMPHIQIVKFCQNRWSLLGRLFSYMYIKRATEHKQSIDCDIKGPIGLPTQHFAVDLYFFIT